MNLNPSYQANELKYALEKVGVRMVIAPKQFKHQKYYQSLVEVGLLLHLKLNPYFFHFVGYLTLLYAIFVIELAKNIKFSSSTGQKILRKKGEFA